MKPSRLLLAVLLALVVHTGCGQQNRPAPKKGPVSTNAVADAASLSAAKEDLTRLSGDSSAYIRNSAKQALTSWESQDYQGAVIAMQKVVSLCRSPSQQEAAMSSLAQLSREIDTAAAQGDANAKEAATTLAQWVSTQQ